jgi:antitoxin component YwqK of YwqJK toxin-antitoxin module
MLKPYMTIIRNVVILFALLVALYYGLLISHAKIVQKEMTATKSVMLTEEHSCPDGAEEVIQRWSEVGYSRYCIKDGQKEGKSVAWEGQRLHIEGNYKNGKEEGLWKVYNDDGSVYRLTEYRDGIEVSDKILNGD